MHRDLVAQRAQRESSPAWLRKLSTPPTAGASVDSVAVKLLENRGFMVWFSAVTALIGSSLVGAFAGSIAWGAMMMFYRAIKGEWMEAGAGPSGLAPAAPIRSIRNIG